VLERLRPGNPGRAVLDALLAHPAGRITNISFPAGQVAEQQLARITARETPRAACCPMCTPAGPGSPAGRHRDWPPCGPARCLRVARRKNSPARPWPARARSAAAWRSFYRGRCPGRLGLFASVTGMGARLNRGPPRGADFFALLREGRMSLKCQREKGLDRCRNSSFVCMGRGTSAEAQRRAKKKKAGCRRTGVRGAVRRVRRRGLTVRGQTSGRVSGRAWLSHRHAAGLGGDSHGPVNDGNWGQGLVVACGDHFSPNRACRRASRGRWAVGPGCWQRAGR